jgi:predicted nuclease of predicted toxin-antitoxin system
VRIKLDENLPASLVEDLRLLGHDVDTVPLEGLAGKVDSAIWSACQRDRRLLVTQDLDFSDIRKYAPGTHHGLVLVRLAVPSRKNLLERLRAAFRTEHTVDWHGGFIIVTDIKTRVRRAP